VQAPGFSRFTDKGINLKVGQIANLPITLQLPSVTAEVTVSTDASIVETQRTSLATTVDQTRIDNLPINGRNYINFTLTNSQVARDTTPSIGAAPTSGLNIGGQRARANLVNVDGADADDSSVNGVRSTVSQEAVQEFQLITNGYAAEYGRASGGVVNIVTRSGSDAVHGTAFGYLRNRNIQAVNPFSTEPNPAYTRVQSGFTLSGPIKKDQTFYFFSFENTRRHETGFSSIGAKNFGLTTLTLPGLGDVQKSIHDIVSVSGGRLLRSGHDRRTAGRDWWTPGVPQQLYAANAGLRPAAGLVHQFELSAGQLPRIRRNEYLFAAPGSPFR
jgi:hypothetical protein